MKYLKGYKLIFENHKDIHNICIKNNIENYIINDDGTIDVDDNVNIISYGLTELPLNFRKVSGDFNCSINKLISLKGSPKEVGGNFNCSYNKLTSLEDCPQSVGKSFRCSHNELTSLEGGPKSVGNDFYCSDNQLITLEGSPKSIKGRFYCYSNELVNLEGAPQLVEGDFDCDNNKLTTLEGGLISVGSDFKCEINELIDLNGFPKVSGNIFIYDNPVSEIIELFPKEKFNEAIYWLIEYDVIRDGNIVIKSRLEEVFLELGLDIPSDIDLENYKLK